MAESSTPPQEPLQFDTVDDYFAWARDQDGRHELADGQVIAMSPQRQIHLLTKARVWAALDAAIRQSRADCVAFPDGATVVVDERTAYEPDAVVQCAERIQLDAITVDNPCVVVEVLSSSTSHRDRGEKLVDYFRVPSVQHYLVVHPQRRCVVHHRRTSTSELATSIHYEGPLTLTPPGLTVEVTSLFVPHP